MQGVNSPNCRHCDIEGGRSDVICCSDHLSLDDPEVVNEYQRENGNRTPGDLMLVEAWPFTGELLRALDPRTRYAVEARFGMVDGKGWTFDEIGESLGITAEAANLLVSSAVAWLRVDNDHVGSVTSTTSEYSNHFTWTTTTE